MSKYKSVATVVDGIRFHSKRESERYRELKLLEKAGEIGRMVLQPSFDLVVPQTSVGARLKMAAARMQGHDPLTAVPHVKVGRFVADFSYWTRDDQYVIEDVKGFMTQLARWKIRHVEVQYGIKVAIIR